MNQVCLSACPTVPGMIGLCTILPPSCAWQIWQRSRKSCITSRGMWLPCSTKYSPFCSAPHDTLAHVPPTLVRAACCLPSPSPDSIVHSHLQSSVHRNITCSFPIMIIYTHFYHFQYLHSPHLPPQQLLVNRKIPLLTRIIWSEFCK